MLRTIRGNIRKILGKCWVRFVEILKNTEKLCGDIRRKLYAVLNKLRPMSKFGKNFSIWSENYQDYLKL